jgi:hypothetical protein
MEISYQEYKQRFQLDEYSIENQSSQSFLGYYGSFIALTVTTLFGYTFYNSPQFRRNTIEFCFSAYDYCYDKFYKLWYDEKVRVVISRIHSHSDKNFKVIVLKKLKAQELKNKIEELLSQNITDDELLEFEPICTIDTEKKETTEQNQVSDQQVDEEAKNEKNDEDEESKNEKSDEDEDKDKDKEASQESEQESKNEKSDEDEEEDEEEASQESDEEEEEEEDYIINSATNPNDILINFFESDLIFHHIAFKEFDYYIIDNYADHHFKFSDKDIIDFPWLSATLEIKTDRDLFSYEVSNKLKYYWVYGNKLPLSIDYYDFWISELTNEKLPSHNDVKMVSLTVIDDKGEFCQFSEVLILPNEKKTIIIDFPFSK